MDWFPSPSRRRNVRHNKPPKHGRASGSERRHPVPNTATQRHTLTSTMTLTLRRMAHCRSPRSETDGEKERQTDRQTGYRDRQTERGEISDDLAIGVVWHLGMDDNWFAGPSRRKESTSMFAELAEFQTRSARPRP